MARGTITSLSKLPFLKSAVIMYIICNISLNPVDASFSFKLKKNSLECFQVNASGHARSLISANYETIGTYSPRKKDSITVSFQKNESKGNKDKSVFGDEAIGRKFSALKAEDTYSEVGRGVYELCFKANKYAETIEIGFHIHVENLHDRAKNKAKEEKDLKKRKLQEDQAKKKAEAQKRKEYWADDYEHYYFADDDKSWEDSPDQQSARLLHNMAMINQQFNRMDDHQLFLQKRFSVHRDLSENIFTKVIRWTLFELVIVLIMAIFQVLHIRRSFNKKQVF